MCTPLQPIAPSIDDPIALLLACHDKVRRFSTLAVRLRDHLDVHAPDEQAQEAARSVLRYFNVAAPLHHDDEEQDLFPALRSLGLPVLNQAMDQLDAEHAELASLWRSLQDWLEDTAQGVAHAPPQEVEAFARRYAAHAQREEDEVYPHAGQLNPAQIDHICAAMVARRSAA